MRINNIGTPVVTVPEAGPQVDAVRGTKPIGEGAAGATTPAPLAPAAGRSAPAAEPEAPRSEALGERRLDGRRGEDRRKQQQPVLIDTRVSQRRRRRRRSRDAPPGSVDVDA